MIYYEKYIKSIKDWNSIVNKFLLKDIKWIYLFFLINDVRNISI